MIDFSEFKVVLRSESIGWAMKHELDYKARIVIRISLFTIE